MAKYIILNGNGVVQEIQETAEAIANPPPNWIEVADATEIAVGQTYSVANEITPQVDYYPMYSTYEIFRAYNETHDLEQDLTAIEADIATLETSVAGKANSTHSHAASDITGLPTTLPANGGNADTVDNKHASEFATANHTHTAADIGAATLLAVYPVGSIYLSINNTNPGTLFGGTWELFSPGRVLMGATSGSTAGATGGSETATIAAHSHTTQSHALTIAELPGHQHELLNYNETGYTTSTFTNNSTPGYNKVGYTGNVMTTFTGLNQPHSHGDTGSAGATTVNVVQPYITCYMWKRTA